MDHSAEMSIQETLAIRGQMDETRHALTEKLGMLEKQVTDTVQGAADTVENVKHAVEDTVYNVKASVRETVDAVGEAFNLAHHVERHPWPMVAGATAVGFVGGYMLMKKSPDELADAKFRHLSASQGSMPQGSYNGGSSFEPSPASRPSNYAPPAERAPKQPSQLMAGLSEWLGPASTQLQGLAVGTALGLLRDIVVKSVPKQLEGQMTEIINGLTTSLGGQVMKGSILGEQTNQQEQRWS
ncbi:hypothetical protein ETAA8_48020 [Anatilimnocola aggregata]|uniref:Uncharacterized protein n=1 Tax=Anatilimnocola aggregata TaxID=2528021 RepID=A0A517YHH2_9BACT|nr:hypothetical protein [Anatilimnocola aggregata]QDU29687.1 hypothetical protein ETAA8_48020 [Anatilimnocola aggregata]